jgi:T-complex protein 1 subunit alpha
LKLISEFSISIEKENIGILKEIVKTSLSSKILGINSDFFSDLVVKSCLKLNECLSFNSNKEIIRRLHVEKIIGKSILKSEMVDGVLISKKFNVVKKIENAKILISKLELSTYQTKIFETKFQVKSHSEGEELNHFEFQKMKEICETISNLNINVVFNSSPISSFVEE